MMPGPSFYILFQRFEGGEAAEVDETAVLDVLVPLIEERGDSWARILSPTGMRTCMASNKAALSGRVVSMRAERAGPTGRSPAHGRLT